MHLAAMPGTKAGLSGATVFAAAATLCAHALVYFFCARRMVLMFNQWLVRHSPQGVSYAGAHMTALSVIRISAC